MSTSRPDRPRLVLTSGEPAGIGPEICAQLAAARVGGPDDADLTLLGDRDLISQRARALGIDPSTLQIEHHPLAVACVAGRPDPRNAGQVLAMLDTALDGLRDGRWDAMVTAPVQKSTIAASGVRFSGAQGGGEQGTDALTVQVSFQYRGLTINGASPIDDQSISRQVV